MQQEDENWDMITDDTASAGPFMHVVSDTEIYARIDDKICKWDGSAWMPITDAAPEALGAYFHFVSETEIYAFIGQRICQWTGAGWSILTDPDTPNAGLHPDSQFHFVSETEIYAFLGEQICMWDGLAWMPHTLDSPDLVPGGMHVASPDAIYAVIGQKICKWDGLADAGVGAWTPLTDDNATMKPDFAFTSESSIHAVLGQQVCEWDGTGWMPITEDAPVSLHPNLHVTGSDILVIGTDGVIYNSL